MSHIEQNCLLVNRVRGYSYPDPHNLVHLETLLMSYHELGHVTHVQVICFFFSLPFWDNYVNHK